jgi:alanine dehydrogenase
MLIGCPKEVKNHEYRVGLTPSAVYQLISNNHEVIIEKNAGIGSGFTNDNYISVGATVSQTADEVFSKSDMIVKVKEPQKFERAKLKDDQILFTYLHLAPDKEQTKDLIDRRVTAFAYETVTDDNGTLPLLAPMSEVAGRLAPQMGAWALQKANGGSGKLLAGVPGVEPANVLIIGGGVVGTQAALIASGMGARVTLMDNSIQRLKYLDQIFFSKFSTKFSSTQNISESITDSDMIIGAVLIPGAEAPTLLSQKQLSLMKLGSVLVDVAIDQGGCFETSKATTHDSPTYEIDGIVHYCVANMPGAVPNTSTLALSHATTPFILKLANMGWKTACANDNNLLNGLNVQDGHVTNVAVSEAQGLDFLNPSTLLNS